MNREHAILGADRCVAVSPSDTAPALIALDAQMVIRRRGAERVVNAADYFLGPDIDITRMTVLQPGELLTAIRIPATWAGARFYFEKVRDRQVWDFPLVNVASAIKESGGRISEARIVVGAVAARPLRLTAVEQALAGQAITEDTATRAGELAITGAQALRFNAYKIPLMRNLVRRAGAAARCRPRRRAALLPLSCAGNAGFVSSRWPRSRPAARTSIARSQRQRRLPPPRTTWHPLGTWSGRGDRQTDSFDVTTGALRIHWETSHETTPGAGRFKVSLHSAISGRPLQTGDRRARRRRATSRTSRTIRGCRIW